MGIMVFFTMGNGGFISSTVVLLSLQKLAVSPSAERSLTAQLIGNARGGMNLRSLDAEP